MSYAEDFNVDLMHQGGQKVEKYTKAVTAKQDAESQTDASRLLNHHGIIETLWN